MSDWQPGDLALCVVDPKSSNARKGAIYLVQDVVGPLQQYRKGPSIGLVLDGVEHPKAFALWGVHACSARAFRKVTPPKADEFDREVIELMTGKPVREPVS